MTSEGMGEMFEGDSADTFAGKFPLVSIGGRAEGLACADPGARTPIGARGIWFVLMSKVIQFLPLLILQTPLPLVYRRPCYCQHLSVLAGGSLVGEKNVFSS